MITRTLDSFFRSEKKRPIRNEKKNKRAILNVLELESRIVPSANNFTPGDYVIYQVGDGSSHTGGYPVYLDELTPGGVLVQSIGVSSAGVNPLTSATSGAQSFLTDSADGQAVVLAGYDVAVGTSTSGTETTVGEVNAFGAVDTSTVDSTTGLTVRSATANTAGAGGQIWIASSSAGVQSMSFGTTAAATSVETNTPNTRVVEISNGQLYVSDDSTVGSNAQWVGNVGSGLPTSGSLSIGAIGVNSTTQAGGAYDYFFADVGSSTPNVLYVTGGTTIDKFTGSGTSWTADGSIADPFASADSTGITGTVSGNTITLYVTDGTFSAENKLYEIVDTSGTGAMSSGTTTVTNPVTAPSLEYFHGIANAPVNPSLAATTLGTVTGPASAAAGIAFSASVPASSNLNGLSVTFEAVLVGATNPQFVNVGTGSVTSGTASGNVTIPSNGTYQIYAYFAGTGSLNAAISSTPLSVTVGTPSAPAFSGPTNATFEPGFTGSFQFMATGNPPSITYSETGVLPAGVTLSSSGLLSGIATTTASYSITVTATNSTGPTSEGFTLNVTPGVGGTPTNSSKIEQDGPYGGTTGINMYGSTGNTYPGFGLFDETVAARPNASSITSLTFQLNEDNDAAYAGGQMDLYLATGSGTTVAYTSLAYQPAAAGGTGSTLNGYAAIDPQLNAIGMDAGNDPLATASYVPSAANTGALTFTLSAAEISGYAPLQSAITSTLQSGGVLRFIAVPDVAAVAYEVYGSTGANPPDLNINYTPGAAPYITSAASTTFKLGTAGQLFQVTADGTATITYAATYGAGMTAGTGVPGVTLSSGGLLSGTPTTSGVYTFTITASNGQPAGSYPSTQTFTLTVTSPVFTSADNVGEPSGTAFNFSFTTTPTLVSLNYTGTLPTGLSLSNAGVLTGSTVQVGEYTISVTAVTSSGNVSETFYIAAQPQAGMTTNFQAGDIVVYQIGNGVAALSGTHAIPVFLAEYNPGGGLFQLIPMPTVASGTTVNPLTEVAGYGATGFLTDSDDGHILLLTGQDAAAGTTGLSATTGAQTIAEVGFNGSINTSTVDNASSIGAVRSATTDGSSTNIWESTSTGGVRLTTLGNDGPSTLISTSGASNVSNTRVVEIAGTGANEQLYVSSDSGAGTGISTVGSAGSLPTSGAAVNLLPGLSSSDFPGGAGTNGPYEYWFTTLNAADTSPDTLYLASEANGIQKFTLQDSGPNTGMWEPTGQINGDTSTNEIQGITGSVNAVTGAVTLYVTNGVYSAATGGYIDVVTDTSGYNGTITGNGTSITAATQIATAGTNTQFTSIALVPTDYQDLAPIFVQPAGASPSTTFVATVANSYSVITQTNSNDTVAQYNSGTGGYSATGLPTGVSINQMTGVISGTPLGSDPIQAYAVVISATNNKGTTNQNFTINLVAASPPVFGTPTSVLTDDVSNPVADVVTSTSATINAGIESPIQFHATGEPTAITYAASTGGGQTGLPATLSMSSGGVLTGVPTADATYTFTVTATNAAGSTSEAFTLSVTGIIGTTIDSATVGDTGPRLTGTNVNTTNLDPEGAVASSTLQGFGLVDVTLAATPTVTSINSLSFQVAESTQFTGLAGSVEVWIATGAGVSVSVTSLLNQAGGVSADQFDPQLDYAGTDGVGGFTPLGSATYTPNHGNAVLTYTITAADLSTYVLPTLQTGGTIRLLLAAGTAGTGLSGWGAGTSPMGFSGILPAGAIAPGVSISANFLKSGGIDANTAPINNLAFSNVGGMNLITVTTDGNTTFAAGAHIWVDQSPIAADNGEYTIQTGSSNSNTFTYIDNNGGAASVVGGSFIGTVTCVGGTGSLGTGAVGSSTAPGTQRSMVDSIVYTFATPIAAPTVMITVPAGDSGTVPSSIFIDSPDSTDGGVTGTTWVITFGGTGVVGGSIANGEYQIVLTAGTYTQTDTFYRLLGDLNGDEFVNAADTLKFKQALTNYAAAADFNGDGFVNASDNLKLKAALTGANFNGFVSTL